MPDNLSAAIESLRTSTQKINSITDSASVVVKEVERFLDECGVGIEANVSVREVRDSDGDLEEAVNLWYCRSAGGKFRVCVATIYVEPEYHDLKPWSDCTRETKLETFQKLPDLLILLSKQVCAKVSAAEQTVKTVSALLNGFKKKGS